MMPRRFSLAHLTVLACPPPESVRIAADVGYDFVSFRNMALGLPGEPIYDFAADSALFRETRTALKETGIPLLDLEVARIIDGVDVKSYLPALEKGAELGARHVITCGLSKDPVYTQESFDQLCDMAQPLGLTIDFEFISFAEVNHISQVMAVIKKSGRKNAGLLVDSLHYGRSRVTTEELDAVPRELFHFSQLRDAPMKDHFTREELIATARGQCLYLGEGDIPIKTMLSHMPDIPLSLEVCNPTRAEAIGYKEFARKCLTTAKTYFSTP
jgi:sugar phosphate isomerase/epimerase